MINFVYGAAAAVIVMTINREAGPIFAASVVCMVAVGLIAWIWRETHT